MIVGVLFRCCTEGLGLGAAIRSKGDRGEVDAAIVVEETVDLVVM